MTKNELRTHLKAARQALSEAERQEKSMRIAEQLFCTQEWQSADTIHSYVSFRTEVATERIITRAWAEKKNVVVPIIDPTTNEMLHAEVYPETLFIPDSFGIPTPQVSPDHLYDWHKKILQNLPMCIIVPLLGFDDTCYRIGYGKGHYDRFFAGLSDNTFPRIAKIGCAFQCQCVPELPREAHDIPLDMVITEESLYRPETR